MLSVNEMALNLFEELAEYPEEFNAAVLDFLARQEIQA